MSLVNDLAYNFDLMIKRAKIHKLEPGETIGELARMYNVTEEQIFEANKDRNVEGRKTSLQIGEPVVIPLSAKEYSSQLVGMDLSKQIDSAAKFAGVPLDLFRAMIRIESQNCTQNVSSAGARGCGQLMPNVISLFGLDNPDNPAQNLPASAQYLAALLRAAPGADKNEKEWNSLMMYNWGPGNFNKWYSNKDPEQLTSEAKAHPKKVFDLLGRSVPLVYEKIYQPVSSSFVTTQTNNEQALQEG